MSACDILVIANLNMDLILEQKNSQQTSRSATRTPSRFRPAETATMRQ